MAKIDITSISIHAPARGATSKSSAGIFAIVYFNPRTREGCDGTCPSTCTSKGYFNPRTREGCDNTSVSGKGCRYMISIHAPARGATSRIELEYEDSSISIHAPARGATQITVYDGRTQRISIHAPARGATLPWLSKMHMILHFNPRTREGCDQIIL